MLFSTINQKTIIKNVDNDKVIKLDDIDDKIFDIYPVLCCFNMNLYYDKIYINFSFHSIFVKIKKTYDIDIDYNNIKKTYEWIKHTIKIFLDNINYIL